MTINVTTNNYATVFPLLKIIGKQDGARYNKDVEVRDDYSNRYYYSAYIDGVYYSIIFHGIKNAREIMEKCFLHWW